MRILVCVKRVPAPGAKIVLTPDAQDIDATLLGFTISPHEECAVEEAVRIVEREGGSATVMTLGPPEAEEQLRSAVSVGATSVVLLPSDHPRLGPGFHLSSAGLGHCQAGGGAGRAVRTRPVRQRVRRFRRLPGGYPRGSVPRAPDCDRYQGDRH